MLLVYHSYFTEIKLGKVLEVAKSGTSSSGHWEERQHSRTQDFLCPWFSQPMTWRRLQPASINRWDWTSTAYSLCPMWDSQRTRNGTLLEQDVFKMVTILTGPGIGGNTPTAEPQAWLTAGHLQACTSEPSSPSRFWWTSGRLWHLFFADA